VKPRTLVLVGLGFVLLVFGLVAPPWMAQWGSTAEERARTFPGDQYWPPPVSQETRAITVRAPATVTWEWVTRIGQGRGGFYSYDWLENLFGDDIHNRSDLFPAPTLGVGDTIRLTQAGYPGARPGFTALPVVGVEDGRSFVLMGWGTFVVESLAPDRSRVLVRERPRHPASAFEATVRALVWDPVHFVMERQMLRGIRDRAEGVAPDPLGGLMAGAGFLAAAVAAAILLVRRRHPAWLLPSVAVAALVLVSTGGVAAALAGFAALLVPGVLRTLLPRARWLTFLVLLGAVLLVLLAAPDAYLALGWLTGAVTMGLVVWTGVSGKELGTGLPLPAY